MEVVTICRESKGEKEIRKYLNLNNIKFIPQYKFSDCKDIRILPFDFYLPDLNVCIEYDGIQHFKEIQKWGGLNSLKDIEKKDQIKTDYCKNKKILLIRIKYSEDVFIKITNSLNNFKYEC